MDELTYHIAKEHVLNWIVRDVRNIDKQQEKPGLGEITDEELGNRLMLQALCLWWHVIREDETATVEVRDLLKSMKLMFFEQLSQVVEPAVMTE
jgi:hypothetical protein